MFLKVYTALNILDYSYNALIVYRQTLVISGFYQTDYLPTERGFDSFFGFYGGNLDYYDHIGTHEGYVGLDFHNDTSGQRKNMWGYFGTYSTDLYTQRAEEVRR